MTGLVILGWSTRDLPPGKVVDYATHAIGEGLEPMRVEIPDPAEFNASLQCVMMGEVVVAQGMGAGMRGTHARREIARDAGRNYHLILNRRSSWTLRHRGDSLLRVDDAVVMDSAFEYDFTYPSFDNTHLQLSGSWMRQWVSDPSLLAGRAILKDSSWGAALCACLRMITPAFMVDAPLPPRLVIDHLGALLAMVAGHLDAGPAPRRSGSLSPASWTGCASGAPNPLLSHPTWRPRSASPQERCTGIWAHPARPSEAC